MLVFRGVLSGMILQVLLISKRSPSTRGAVRDDSSRCPKIKWSWDRLRHDPHLRSKTHHEENGSFKMESIGKSFKKILLLLSHFASKWPKKWNSKKKHIPTQKQHKTTIYNQKACFPKCFFRGYLPGPWVFSPPPHGPRLNLGVQQGCYHLLVAIHGSPGKRDPALMREGKQPTNPNQPRKTIPTKWSKCQ